jgi:hypothetical protein
MRTSTKIGLLIAGLFVAGGVATAASLPQPATTATDSSRSSTSAAAPHPTTAKAHKPTAKPAAKPVTDGQEQAVGKAEDYLDFTNFSRKGLISQLKYDGFSAADAAYAADHVGADWNVQATKKGQSYLELTHFSKAGLVAQLKYDGFTEQQARLGAAAAFITR